MTIFRFVADWEERLSLFLREAIDQPHREPEVCEDLIEYVLFLVNSDRRTRKRRLEALLSVSGATNPSPKGVPPEVL